MTANAEDDKPMLASLVQAGDQQSEAMPINDFIFMAKDISNAYLVNTDDGDVMINTGFVASAERNKAVFESVRSGALKAIILTQAHADHFGGVPEFLEPGTKIIAERRFTDTCHFFNMLDAYLRRRSGRLWTGTIKRRDIVVPEVIPDIAVDGEYDFVLGGRSFQVISTPGGEAPDSVVVWLPNERIVFTGNLFGPVFMSMPNLCTTRGDKPRSARVYLECLDRVRQLGAETLITGHGDPIIGADKIRADLDKMHAAVSYVHDRTVEGMNAGKDVHTLMAEISLPEEIKIGEYHGKVSWAVRTIWEEYSAWFHMDSTTSLYAVPRSSVNMDLVELAGGADAIAARAAEKVSQGKPLEAIHLLDISLDVQHGHQASLAAKKDALEQLIKASGGTNLGEVMWLKSEVGSVERALNPQQA